MKKEEAAASSSSPHPMVAVPDAIRTVLEITAQTILLASPENVEVLPTNSPPALLLNRILAQDVLMCQPGYPPYRASIMDGYAIQSEKFVDESPTSADQQKQCWSHQVLDRVHAGPSSSSEPSSSNKNDTESTTLPPAIYVTTGARIPDTFDCVVPIELIQESTDKKRIRINKEATIESGKWIRSVGCDIPAGSVVLAKGSTIQPVSLGLLQQSGQATIKVLSPIRVGILSTGNELLVSTDSWAQQHDSGEGHTLIQTGQIPDVNKPILQALLMSFGGSSGSRGEIQPIDLGMERDDDIDSMTKTIQKGASNCHVILTTGGISMGETDIVEDVLVGRLGGKLHFGRLNMKPGKPTTFVTLPPATTNAGHQCLVFALPGNPVSATVCTHLLVHPALNMLQQQYNNNNSDTTTDTVETMIQNTVMPPEITATLTHDIKLDMERPEYHRVIIQSSSSSGGGYTVSSTGVQRSSRLMSLRDAQGLLALRRGSTDKPKALAGEQYTVLLLDTTTTFHHIPPVLFKDSKHVGNNSKQQQGKPPTRVAITQISEGTEKFPIIGDASNENEELSKRVEKALCGSRSGSVKVVTYHEVSGSLEGWSNHFASNNNNNVDVWVVSCSGSFQYCLQVSTFLRERVVTKIADSLALQARRGAASQDGTAALFEPVVGYVQSDDKNAQQQQQGQQHTGGDEGGCILIALPTKGLDGGLDNVRGLLKHAVNVARGKPHNQHHHHHHHQKHSHH